MKIIQKAAGIILALIMAAFPALTANAADVNSLGKGSYAISASLSCYVNAMGGVEFGAPLLTNTTLIVDGSGNKSLKMEFTKSSVTIYSITCDTFVDANPTSQGSERGVKSGTIGYYDKNGKLQTDGVTHTLSDDTALNSRDEAVHYVDSVTFPLDRISNTYSLTLYINSNVMGVQFCNENDAATEATYPATLTVDWNSISVSGSGNSQSGNSSGSGGGQSTSTQNSGSGNSSSGQNQSSAGGQESESQTNFSGETTTAAANENVSEMDGLNIHYAATSGGADGESDVPFYVYLNTPALIGLAVFGGVLTAGGIILIAISKKRKGKRTDDKEI